MNQFDVHIESYIPLDKNWIDQSVFTIFEKIVHQFPDKLAISDCEVEWTYQELYNEVFRFAGFISDNAQGNIAPIGIRKKNDPYFIAAMLACCANGIPYVPLDRNFPNQRNIDIIEDAGVQFILEENQLGENLNEFKANGHVDSICYILYTSGSTGKPKGVFQNQRNMLHDIWQYITSIRLSSTDRSTLFYSPSVNGAIRDIYGTLLTGGTLFIRDLHDKGIIGMDEFISNNKITIYHSIPTIFRSFLKISRIDCYKTVRLVYLAGDRIFTSDYIFFKEFFSKESHLYIGIGSTENATIYRQWFLDHSENIVGELMPVGYAVDDREMQLIDENGNEVLNGEIGEIEVSSPYMSLGYWNNEQLTQQSFGFLANGIRSFRTGDLGKINSQGLLEFLGRKDKQIKINGHRIELDEIAAKIRSVIGVENVALLVREVENSHSIIAYVQSGRGEEDLKNELSTLVPSFMIPAEFHFLERIPLLSNYKIDSQRLKQLDFEILQAKKASSYNEEKSIEEVFRSIWLNYTSEAEFYNNVKWSDTSATSVDAVNFLVDIEKTFQIDFPDSDISKDMTPHFILEKIKECIQNQGDKVKQDFSSKPIVYFFPWLCGVRNGHEKLIQRISKRYDVKVISYPDYENWDKKELTFTFFCKELERLFINEERQMIFFGVLSGVYFSHEMAFRLKERYNKKVIASFLLDYEAPLNQVISLSRIKRGIKNIISKHYTSAQKKILISAKMSKSDVPSYVLALKNRKRKTKGYLRWDNYCSVIRLKEFDFDHRDLAGENNHDKLTGNEVFIEEMENAFLTIADPKNS